MQLSGDGDCMPEQQVQAHGLLVVNKVASCWLQPCLISNAHLVMPVLAVWLGCLCPPVVVASGMLWGVGGCDSLLCQVLGPASLGLLHKTSQLLLLLAANAG
jgi:hypothetical protein